MVGLIMMLPPPTPDITKMTVSEIVANPALLENQTVEVEGMIDGVITIPEVRLPFNHWLVDKGDKKSKIGLLWANDEALEVGSYVRIVGTVTKGYAQRLAMEGWVNSSPVYYIEAITAEPASN